MNIQRISSSCCKVDVRYFSKGTFPSVNFPNVQFPKRQLPGSARPHCSLRCLKRPNLSFGQLPLGKLCIWEVATWKIATLEVTLGKNPLGKYLTPQRYKNIGIKKLENLSLWQKINSLERNWLSNVYNAKFYINLLITSSVIWSNSLKIINITCTKSYQTLYKGGKNKKILLFKCNLLCFLKKF